MSMMTVTLMLPGFTTSWQPTHTPAPPLTRSAAARTELAGGRPAAVLLTLRATVVLWPATSLPDVGETASSPTRPEDSAMNHDTGPPEAVRVRVPPRSGLTTIVRGLTLSVPGAGGRVGAALVAVLVGLALLVVGAGEVGEGRWLGAGL
jgi:hypothetical protein